jgi:hypothetical protein
MLKVAKIAFSCCAVTGAADFYSLSQNEAI